MCARVHLCVRVCLQASAFHLQSPALTNVNMHLQSPALTNVNMHMEDDVNVRWAEYVRAWYAAGARVVGGCCRVTPAIIRVVRSTLEEIVTAERKPG